MYRPSVPTHGEHVPSVAVQQVAVDGEAELGHPVGDQTGGECLDSGGLLCVAGGGPQLRVGEVGRRAAGRRCRRKAACSRRPTLRRKGVRQSPARKGAAGGCDR